KISPKQVRQRYMHRQKGPKGGRTEFAAQDAEGNWVWRYRATQTRLIEYRPTFKKSWRSEEHTSELPSLRHLVCRLLLEKKNINHGGMAGSACAAADINGDHPLDIVCIGS